MVGKSDGVFQGDQGNVLCMRVLVRRQKTEGDGSVGGYIFFPHG